MEKLFKSIGAVLEQWRSAIFQTCNRPCRCFDLIFTPSNFKILQQSWRLTEVLTSMKAPTKQNWYKVVDERPSSAALLELVSQLEGCIKILWPKTLLAWKRNRYSKVNGWVLECKMFRAIIYEEWALWCSEVFQKSYDWYIRLSSEEIRRISADYVAHYLGIVLHMPQPTIRNHDTTVYLLKHHARNYSRQCSRWREPINSIRALSKNILI